jgi:hypothetical protein
MVHPDGKTQAQVVAQMVAEAREKSEIGHQFAAVGAPEGTFMEIDPTDPMAVAEVLKYVAAQVLALEKIVTSLADAIDTLSTEPIL